MEAHHLRGQGQRDAVDGIHDQEFFFNTKGTHLPSVDHESGSGRHAPDPSLHGFGVSNGFSSKQNTPR